MKGPTPGFKIMMATLRSMQLPVRCSCPWPTITTGDAQRARFFFPTLESGNVQLVDFLLRSSNAVWNLTDNQGLSAGDVAFSFDHSEIYQHILAEGVRAELLKAMMRKMMGGDAESEDDEVEEASPEEVGADEQNATQQHKLSTAGSNKTFLASRLKYEVDAQGQEICVDAEGNGVMMGWEREIMETTARLLCVDSQGTPRTVADQGLRVLNVGFGLGIVRLSRTRSLDALELTVRSPD